MSAILECPSCFKMLKEHGDETKVHKNTYHVYDLGNDELDDIIRIVTCNYCGYAGTPDTFPD